MTDILTTDNVRLGLTAASRDDALATIASVAVELGIAADADEVLAGLIAREELGTTGLMDGIAIPHAQTETVARPGIVVARFDDQLQWESMDDKPIQMAIALFVPSAQKGSTHLELLSGIARTLMDDQVRARLLAENSPEEVVRLLSQQLAL